MTDAPVIDRIRTAALRDDLAARAAFLEGLRGIPEGSLARLNRAPFVAATEAIKIQGENDLVDALLGIGMPEDDVKKFVNHQIDFRFREAMIDEVSKVIAASGHGSGSGRVTAEEVVQSVMVGVSPLTHRPIRRWQNHGIFYYAGVKARGRERTPFNAIRAYVTLVVNRITRDIFTVAQGVEGAQTKRIDDREERASGRGQNAPAADRWMLETDRPALSSSLGERAFAFFHDPQTRHDLDVAVRRRLVGKPIQIAIWQTIFDNPDLVNDKGGVDQMNLAEEVVRLTGRDLTRQAIGRTFRQDVLPAVRIAIEGMTAGRDLLQSLTYYNEIGRMARRVARLYSASVDPATPVEDDCGLDKNAAATCAALRKILGR